jgi:hypothetical protein
MTGLLGESKAAVARAYYLGAMPASVPCFDLVLEMKNALHYRLQLVTYARQHGIKAAAPTFLPPTPSRAMLKPSTPSSKASSSIWNPSPAAPASWPRLPFTSTTSTSACFPIFIQDQGTESEYEKGRILLFLSKQ